MWDSTANLTRQCPSAAVDGDENTGDTYMTSDINL